MVDLTGGLSGGARFISLSAELCNHPRPFEHDHHAGRGERSSSEIVLLAEDSEGFARRLDVVEHADEADEGLSTLLPRLRSRGRAACCCERRPPRGPASAIIDHHVTAFAAYRQAVSRTHVMPSSTVQDKTTIFVALMDEGTNVWRSVAAERVSDGRYLIVGVCDTADETWQFSPGSIVRCEQREFPGGEWRLAAVELVVPAG